MNKALTFFCRNLEKEETLTKSQLGSPSLLWFTLRDLCLFQQVKTEARVGVWRNKIGIRFLLFLCVFIVLFFSAGIGDWEKEICYLLHLATFEREKGFEALCWWQTDSGKPL